MLQSYYCADMYKIRNLCKIAQISYFVHIPWLYTLKMIVLNQVAYHQCITGAQWHSGRVLDSRPRGRGFEHDRRHCVVVLERDTFILA